MGCDVAIRATPNNDLPQALKTKFRQQNKWPSHISPAFTRYGFLSYSRSRRHHQRRLCLKLHRQLVISLNFIMNPPESSILWLQIYQIVYTWPWQLITVFDWHAVLVALNLARIESQKVSRRTLKATIYVLESSSIHIVGSDMLGHLVESNSTRASGENTGRSTGGANILNQDYLLHNVWHLSTTLLAKPPICTAQDPTQQEAMIFEPAQKVSEPIFSDLDRLESVWEHGIVHFLPSRRWEIWDFWLFDLTTAALSST